MEWLNFDISPTLRAQKLPIIGNIIRNRIKAVFPKNVKYGDIIKGLPIQNNSCDGLYCSHTLEHLSLEDFRKAIKNSFALLKEGGIFRCVVPDLEIMARNYIKSLETGNNSASVKFMQDTLMGVVSRPRSFKELVSMLFGNKNHLWMWDALSMAEELHKVGFVKIRNCQYNDCEDSMFNLVEDPDRFENAVAIECRK